GQREKPRAGVDVSGAGRRRVADDAARRRRHHVPDAAAERRGRARREDRTRILDLSVSASGYADRLLRREQPRRRDSRRHLIYGYAGRPSDRPRREERPSAVEYHGGRRKVGLL